MSTKKKLIIIICVISIFALTSVIALVAVFAAFTGKVTGGGFDISYTAKNVQAEITAEYKKSSDLEYTAITTADGTNIIAFDSSDDTEEKTKSFNNVNAFSITKNEYVIIHYTITNTDTTNNTTFNVSVNTSIMSDNMAIAFASSEAEETSSDWKQTIAEVIDAGNVSNGTPLELYIKVSIKNRTKSASFGGTYGFTLTIND